MINFEKFIDKKVMEEVCLCKGQAKPVYFEGTIPILKCSKCGDEFEATET